MTYLKGPDLPLTNSLSNLAFILIFVYSFIVMSLVWLVWLTPFTYPSKSILHSHTRPLISPNANRLRPSTSLSSSEGRSDGFGTMLVSHLTLGSSGLFRKSGHVWTWEQEGNRGRKGGWISQRKGVREERGQKKQAKRQRTRTNENLPWFDIRKV